jgi:hypothetical protein
MAKATAHPDRRLISSEDVEGTEVYGSGDEVIGEIDHLLIEKVAVVQGTPQNPSCSGDPYPTCS